MKEKKLFKAAISLLLVVITVFTMAFCSFAAAPSKIYLKTGYEEMGFSKYYNGEKGKKDVYGTYYYEEDNYTGNAGFVKSLYGVNSTKTRLYKCSKDGFVCYFITDSLKHTKGKKDVAVNGDYTIKTTKTLTKKTVKSFNSEIGCKVAGDIVSASAKVGVSEEFSSSWSKSIEKSAKLKVSKNDKTGYYALRIRIPCSKFMQIEGKYNYWTDNSKIEDTYFYNPIGNPIVETVYSKTGTGNWVVM